MLRLLKDKKGMRNYKGTSYYNIIDIVMKYYKERLQQIFLDLASIKDFLEKDKEKIEKYYGKYDTEI
jgi:hypothetical protein